MGSMALAQEQNERPVKEDISFPEVKKVFVAMVREEHREYHTMDWNAYIINDRKDTIETVLIVSKGYAEGKETSVMRHKVKELPPQSFAKIEFLQEDLLKLNNEFSVTFFAEGQMFHKKFVFTKNSINEQALRDIPVMQQKGVLVK